MRDEIDDRVSRGRERIAFVRLLRKMSEHVCVLFLVGSNWMSV